MQGIIFQSTSSVWRTTHPGGWWRRGEHHFNPRPPCGGRQLDNDGGNHTAKFQSTSSVWRTTPHTKSHTLFVFISIHVLRVEDDAPETSSVSVLLHFNPRPPCGGRLRPHFLESCHTNISIHVLRVEDDAAFSASVSFPLHFNPRPPCGGRLAQPVLFLNEIHFNPRPPCGGRQIHLSRRTHMAKFQSTSSVWRTTRSASRWALLTSISIHVLRVEDDDRRADRLVGLPHFNPRPPCGGRRPGR